MKRRLSFYLSFVWLVIITGVAIKGLYKIYEESIGVPNGDAYWVYLPGGQRFLDDPWGFLTTDALSYNVAPLGYLWSAVWGVNELTIKIANCVLFLIGLYLMWRVAKRLGGYVAAVLATFMWATTHTLLHAIPKVLTEAMFLFGFMLFLFGLVEAIASASPRKRWFALAGVGLTITLLSRPVLQYIILGVLALMALGYVAYRAGWVTRVSERQKLIFSRGLRTLLLALVLPVLVIVKNGVYFQNWGIGTGAGAGLFYGVHPLHMGEEPFYTNFLYDVGQTAFTIDPNTKGNLDKDADRWERRIAKEMVIRTSFGDNLKFFLGKARSWLIYSPVERYFEIKQRVRRQAMVLLTMAGMIMLAVLASTRGSAGVTRAFRRIVDGGNASDAAVVPNAYSPGNVAGGDAGTHVGGVIFCLIALLLLAAGMIAQFLPVLYNSRYNGAFLDPVFVILGSVGLALITSHIRWPSRVDASASNPRWSWTGMAWQVSLLVLLFVVHNAAITWSVRHERLVLDPYRLGPAKTVLEGDHFGNSEAKGMESVGNNTWVTREWQSVLSIPVNVPEGVRVDKAAIYEAMWRVRLAVSAASGKIPNSCRDVTLKFSNVEDSYSPLPTTIFLSRDGQMKTYALSGGFGLRPKGSGVLSLHFDCPLGTKIQWGGAEFLRSTIPEASKELIHNDVPLSPYQNYEPRLPGKDSGAGVQKS